MSPSSSTSAPLSFFILVCRLASDPNLLGTFRRRSLVRTLFVLEAAEEFPLIGVATDTEVIIFGEGRVFEGVGEGRGIAWLVAETPDTIPPSEGFAGFSLILGYMAVAMTGRRVRRTDRLDLPKAYPSWWWR